MATIRRNLPQCYEKCSKEAFRKLMLVLRNFTIRRRNLGGTEKQLTCPSARKGVEKLKVPDTPVLKSLKE